MLFRGNIQIVIADLREHCKDDDDNTQLWYAILHMRTIGQKCFWTAQDLDALINEIAGDKHAERN